MSHCLLKDTQVLPICSGKCCSAECLVQEFTHFISRVCRIEKEIEALETQELNISANEEAVLKRLKEVERTPEDIIKVNAAAFSSSLLSWLPRCVLLINSALIC